MRTSSTRDLPAAIRLNQTFDPAALQHDLAVLEGDAWPPEMPYTFEGFFGGETKVYHDGKWVGLSLRSQGGRADRTDPGGPGLDEFDDTPLLRRTPYLKSVLDRLGRPLRSARLLRLPPGGVIGEHRDTYHGFEYGQLRLHIAITTNPGIENIIRGQRWMWQPGELWYGDFGSLHSVRNTGDRDRVHLVIDVVVTPETLALFPPDVAEQAARLDILFHEESIALSGAALQRLACRFRLPSTLVRGIFDIDDGIVAELDAQLVVRDGRLVLNVENRDLFTLRPLAENRLAFAGWTMERYLEYRCTKAGVTELSLVLRRGSDATRVVFNVEAPDVRAEAEPAGALSASAPHA